MRWSAGLHFIGALGDCPGSHCTYPGERGWAGKENINVLGAVRNVTGILERWVDGHEDMGKANEALKFLVHFMGDMHQPLHLTGRDRGGNSVNVTFDGRRTSAFSSSSKPVDMTDLSPSIDLHSLWDTYMIAKALRNMPDNYTHPLPSPQVEYALRGAIYDSYVRRMMWEGVLDKWKGKMDEWLACPQSTPPSAPETWSQQVMALLAPKKPGSGGGAKEWDDGVVCPFAWSEPIHKFNCDFLWPKALDQPPYDARSCAEPSLSSSSSWKPCRHHALTPEDELDQLSRAPVANKDEYLELDTPEYAGVLARDWVIEELLAKAGVRLAAVLNYLFAEQGEHGQVVDVTVF
jgi:hypothetical protein